MFRRISGLALAIAVLAGCRDHSAVAASIPVFTDTLVAYALSGTPVEYPSALNMLAGTTVRVDGTGDFDIAFDTASGKVVINPVRLLVSPYAGAVSVGLQVQTTPFDQITSAPGGYYRPDTALVVSTGQPFVVLTTRPSGSQTCVFLSTPHIYSKMVIDSVNTATGAIYFRQVIDPNCGFRSFLPGLPTS